MGIQSTLRIVIHTYMGSEGTPVNFDAEQLGVSVCRSIESFNRIRSATESLPWRWHIQTNGSIRTELLQKDVVSIGWDPKVSYEHKFILQLERAWLSRGVNLRFFAIDSAVKETESSPSIFFEFLLHRSGGTFQLKIAHDNSSAAVGRVDKFIIGGVMEKGAYMRNDLFEEIYTHNHRDKLLRGIRFMDTVLATVAETVPQKKVD